MTHEDKKRFAVLIYWLADRMVSAGGQPKKVTPETLKDYFEALADIRIERLEWGAKHYFAHNRFFPMPVDLREAASLAPSTVLPQKPVALIPEDCTPPEVAREKLSEIVAVLNGEFGTHFEVGEGSGRPQLKVVPGGRTG